MRRALATLALCLAAGAAAADRPARVVSMNLCTDQLAMLLAAPGQLVSVSRIASDPLSSPLAAMAGDYVPNDGGAEEIYLMHPDIVLAANWSDPVAIAMLRRLGVTVVELPIATALADIPDQVRAVGAALGRNTQADAMAAGVEARLASLPNSDGAGPVAAFYYANGYTVGTGTLGSDIVRAAGFRNLAERLGMAGGGTLPLETLVMADPDLVITSAPYAGASEAEAVTHHPALKRFVDGGRLIRSGPEWVCGTPFTLDAVSQMADLRAQVEGQAGQ